MKNNQLIIGLVGNIGSGKDTLANILVESFGFQKTSFAAGLKDVVASAFGWPREKIEGDTPENREWREKPDEWWSARLGRIITPRLMLQNWGTDLVRKHFSDDFWIANCERRIQSLLEQLNFVVISDVRFPNEAKCIKDMGGFVIRVCRELVENSLDENVAKHSSETFVKDIKEDFTLDNNSHVIDLKLRLIGLLMDNLKIFVSEDVNFYKSKLGNKIWVRRYYPLEERVEDFRGGLVAVSATHIYLRTSDEEEYPLKIEVHDLLKFIT